MNEQHLNNWLNKRKERRNILSSTMLFESICQKDISALSTAITLLESTKISDQRIAQELITLCLPHAGNALRIGITGVPGVGKSTFIEAFGKILVQQGHRVAVLAIDPSSEISGGSILGDKTRMEELSMLQEVFIRPSPTGKTLGGVARRTRESIFLCEAAGFDIILIETVGVGQSETMVHSMVDFFLLLMLSGAGDELQGIKRGIMEMADALVITKADGENIQKAKLAQKEYQNAMHLFPPQSNEWIPKALICSAIEKENLHEILEIIRSFENLTKVNGTFPKKRHEQDKFWFQETLKDLLFTHFFSDTERQQKITQAEKDVFEGKISSFEAAEKIFINYCKTDGTNV